MSIEYVKGNLLTYPGIDIIVGQNNCFNVMGAGLAAQIAAKYPEAVEADNATTKGDKGKLGGFSYAKADDGKIIVNLYSQYNYGTDKRQTDYEAFYQGMSVLHDKVLDQKKNLVFGVPKFIGAGLSGGSWKIIHAMLEEIFLDSKIKLIIVEYSK